MKTTALLGLLVVVSATSACANVMYFQRFRPVDVEIRIPKATPSSLLVWTPEPVTAVSVASKLKDGLFSPAELGAPVEYAVTADAPIMVVAEGYGVRTCSLRVLGLPRPRNPASRPLLLVAVKLAAGASYYIFTVSSGRSISAYQVDLHADVPEVLEQISGHPVSSVKRGKRRDRLTVYVSELGGSTPNNTMNPTVGVGLGASFVRTFAHRGLW